MDWYMQKEALLKRLREEHKRYMAGLQEEIRAEVSIPASFPSPHTAKLMHVIYCRRRI